uniref:Uncharacterized protein n=1 Tax=Mantoniella tinhauana virus 1 TaxID=3111543 RepID=A0AB38ZLZ9_9VIRU
MGNLHKAYFNGLVGYYNPDTGRVKLGDRTFPNIMVAIKYIGKK